MGYVSRCKQFLGGEGGELSSGSKFYLAMLSERQIELLYSTTITVIFGEFQLKYWSKCLAPGPEPLTRSIRSGKSKLNPQLLLHRHLEKAEMPEIPIIKGPNYCHPGCLVGGGRIIFTPNKLLAYGYFDAI